MMMDAPVQVAVRFAEIPPWPTLAETARRSRHVNAQLTEKRRLLITVSFNEAPSLAPPVMQAQGVHERRPRNYSRDLISTVLQVQASKIPSLSGSLARCTHTPSPVMYKIQRTE